MSAELPPFEAGSFPSDPNLECDIVMKGGITSGVIYPLAVCELAQVYKLRSVGGSSAGAIAAAAAAAAEVGRATGRGLGFLGLADFPHLLVAPQDDGRPLLFHLLRPQPGARRIFAVLMSVTEGAAALPQPATLGAKVALAVSLIRRTAARYLLRTLLGALLGLVVVVGAVLSVLDDRDSVGGVGVAGIVIAVVLIVIGLVVALAGMVVGLLTGVVADLGRLSDLDFGLTSGMGEQESDTALTPWLHTQLQALAGRTEAEGPLTFGDLQHAEVDFRVMTTNLSRRQPLSMPWADQTYFFDPDQFRTLFPKSVVDAMVTGAPPLPTGPAERREQEVLRRLAWPLLPFPAADQLPILVATRMSLSFPLLISAVPLYTLDDTTRPGATFAGDVAGWLHEHPGGTLEDQVRAVHRPGFDLNWFSDGGLTDNLPVHFFDSPLPTRPTFAIDLAAFSAEHPQSTNEQDNSDLPTINQGGLSRRTDRWPDAPLPRLLAFGISLVTTARTWVDEAQLTMPGYRDRVVTVFRSSREGGLNLSMSKETVQGLSERGRFAAGRLVSQFAGDTPGVPAPGWDNHRWVRFRSAAAGLSDWFGAFEHGFATPAAPTTPYATMLASVQAQPSMPIQGARLVAARARVASLRTEADAWAGDPADAFTAGRPSPPPVLRLVAGEREAGPDPSVGRGPSSGQR